MKLNQSDTPVPSKVKSSGIRKWTDANDLIKCLQGSNTEDKIMAYLRWWRESGRIMCAFCSHFDPYLPNCGGCPLKQDDVGACHPAWQRIHDERWISHSFIDIFEQAVPEMLRAIENVKEAE